MSASQTKIEVFFPSHEDVSATWAFSVLAKARFDWREDREMKTVNTDYKYFTRGGRSMEQWSYEVEFQT